MFPYRFAHLRKCRNKEIQNGNHYQAVVDDGKNLSKKIINTQLLYVHCVFDYAKRWTTSVVKIAKEHYDSLFEITGVGILFACMFVTNIHPVKL